MSPWIVGNPPTEKRPSRLLTVRAGVPLVGVQLTGTRPTDRPSSPTTRPTAVVNGSGPTLTTTVLSPLAFPAASVACTPIVRLVTPFGTARSNVNGPVAFVATTVPF